MSNLQKNNVHHTNFVFSESARTLQQTALKIKKENPNISMSALARALNIKMQALKKILAPIGEWLVHSGLTQANTGAVPKVLYPSKKAVNKAEKLADLRQYGGILCEVCKIPDWCGTPIVNIVQFDHIDGNSSNNQTINRSGSISFAYTLLY